MPTKRKATAKPSRKSANVPPPLPMLKDRPDPILFELPLPLPNLKPNGRVHWTVKARDTAKFRRAVYFIAQHLLSLVVINEKRLPCRRANVQLVYRFRHNRRRDTDNLLAWFKAGFDGLTDAGVFVDDAGLTHWPVVVEVVKDGDPGVHVWVEPLE